MTKDEMLELCSSIKKLNTINGASQPFDSESASIMIFKNPSVKEIEARIAELWAVYCGE